jgi:TolB-like protein/DNA-binding winged helix-turn-helix (wHTH) protein/Tfp pilus assembly protein PilF
MGSGPSTGRVLRCGALEIHVRTGELRKGGRKIRLQDQPFQILIMLLDSRGDLVTREELREKLWPGDTFVDFDHGLNNAIKRLRDALGDSADHPRYVETLPRRGYRLILPVDELPRDLTATAISAVAEPTDNPVTPTQGSTVVEEPQTRPRGGDVFRNSWHAVAAGALAVAAMILLTVNLPMTWRNRVGGHPSVRHIQSIAVLPLENLSGDPAQEFFVDGMTDALITDLAKIGSITVISRTSAMQYKGSKEALPQIAQELHVDAIVEGAVVRSGSRVRIDAQLIEALTDKHLWANSYEREEHDIVALQNNVARAIANEIQVKLTPEEQAHLSDDRTINPDAYEDYLQGRYFLNRQTTPETFTKAAEYMRRAVERDPHSALAYAGLADGYAWLGAFGPLPPSKAWEAARSAAKRALAMDDDLAEAHASLALVFFLYDWDWSAAEREFKRAIQLNPGYSVAHFWHAWYLVCLRHFDDALSEAKRAQELDVLSLLANWNLARTLFFARQYDRAMEQCRRVLERDPDYERAHYTLATIYVEKGFYKQAVAESHTRAHVSPHSLWDFSLLAEIYAASGDQPAARRVLAQALQQDRKEGDVHAIVFAKDYLALGEIDQAFQWLEKAYEHRDWPLVQLNVAPYWDPIRSDPRFQDLVRRVGLPR